MTFKGSSSSVLSWTDIATGGAGRIQERKLRQVNVTRPRFNADITVSNGRATWAFDKFHCAISCCSASGHFSVSEASGVERVLCPATGKVEATGTTGAMGVIAGTAGAAGGATCATGAGAGGTMGLMIGVGAICVTGTSLRGATGAAGSRGTGVGGGMGLAIGADVTGVTEISLRGTTGVVGSRGAGGVTTGVGGRGGTKVGVGPTSVCVTGVDDIRGLTGASAFPTGGAIRSGGVTVVGNLASD